MNRLASFAIAAALIGAFAAVRAESQNAEPIKVGFLDVRKVIQDYKKRETIEQELKARAESIEKQVKDARAKVEAKNDKLVSLNPDSDEAVQMDREIQLDMVRLKFEGEWQARRLERERNTRFAQLYSEVCYEVRLQAERGGFASVLVNDPLPTGWEKSSDFVAVLRGRTVLYTDPRLDITQTVTDALNDKLPKAPPK